MHEEWLSCFVSVMLQPAGPGAGGAGGCLSVHQSSQSLAVQLALSRSSLCFLAQSPHECAPPWAFAA